MGLRRPLQKQPAGFMKTKMGCMFTLGTVLAEFEELADTDRENVLVQSKFLLEFDFGRLCKSSLDEQHNTEWGQ